MDAAPIPRITLWPGFGSVIGAGYFLALGVLLNGLGAWSWVVSQPMADQWLLLAGPNYAPGFVLGAFFGEWFERRRRLVI